MADLSSIQGRKEFAATFAAKYGLDAALICAVCEQESGWNPWAMRYEPAFYERYIVPLLLKDGTEAHARSTSYGLMQIMGQVAREHGFSGKFLSELCDPDVGVDFGCKKLQKCLAGRSVEDALLAYNGGGYADYGKQVLSRVTKYQ